MATEKSWLSDASPATDAIDAADGAATRGFDDGEASAWTKHKAPGAFLVVTLTNLDEAADGYVSTGPALQGPTDGTGGEPVGPGEKITLVFDGGTRPLTEFSTFGDGGASHAWALRFEKTP